MKTKDFVLVILPALLWPISFILLHSIFIYALLGSVIVLATVSLLFYKQIISWGKLKNTALLIAIGIIGAAALYAIFYFGNFAASAIGIGGLVDNIYNMIYGNVAKVQLVVLLAFIGLFEEIYWRGALQSYVKRNSRVFKNIPWVATTIYYTVVHISALNPILVVAAFLVGLITSIIADRYGIISSIITHIVWIELIVVLIPVL